MSTDQMNKNITTIPDNTQSDFGYRGGYSNINSNLFDVVVILFLFALTILSVLVYVLPWYFPAHDLSNRYMMFHVIVSDILEHSEIPLWSPNEGYGISNLFQIFYTMGPNEILMVSISYVLGISNIKFIYFASTSLDVFVGGLGMYLLVRQLTRYRPSAAYCAIVFILTLQYDWTPDWGYKIIILYPIIMYCIITSISRNSSRIFLIGALFLALSLYGTLPYYAPFHFYFFLLFISVVTLSAFCNGWRPKVRLYAIDYIIMFSIMILLIGFVLLSTTAFSNMMLISPGRDPVTGSVTFDTFLTWGKYPSLTKIKDIITGLSPHPDIQLYVGLVTLILSLYAVCFCRSNHFVLPISITVVTIFCFSCSDILPVAGWAFHLPGLAMFRHVPYTAVAIKPLIIAMAGIAFHDLTSRPIDKNRRCFLIVVTNLSVALLVIYLMTKANNLSWFYDGVLRQSPFGNFFNPDNSLIPIINHYHIIFDITIVVATSAILRIWHTRISRAKNVAVTTFPTWPMIVIALIGIFDTAGFRAFRVSELYIMFMDMRQITVMSPVSKDTSPSFNLYDKTYGSIFQHQRQSNPNIPVYIMNPGVWYGTVWSFIGVDSCSSIYRQDYYNLYVATALLNYGVSITDMPLLSKLPEDNDLLWAFGCEHDKIQWHTTKYAKNIESINDGFSYSVRSFLANRIELGVRAPTTGTLIYSDGYDPYWVAEIDHKPMAIHKSLFGFKELDIPSGEHIVTLSYRPWLGERVLVAFAFFLVGLYGALLVGIVKFELVGTRSGRTETGKE